MRGSQDDVSKLAGWEKLSLPFFELVQWNVKPWTDRDALIQPSKKIDNDFATPVVVNDLEFANIATVHHHLEELDDDFAAWSDKNLPLATALGVCDCLEGVSQD